MDTTGYAAAARRAQDVLTRRLAILERARTERDHANDLWEEADCPDLAADDDAAWEYTRAQVWYLECSQRAQEASAASDQANALAAAHD